MPYSGQAAAAIVAASSAQLGAVAVQAQLTAANTIAVGGIESASKIALQIAGNAFLTAVGLSKQYDMLGKQGDLFEAQRDVALRSIAIAERTFTDTLLPSYKLSVDFFEKNFRKQWEPVLTKVAACGAKECEYTPDYDRHTTRALADVAKVIAGAKRTARRAMDCYSVGPCAEQDYKLAELQARMVVDTKRLGRTFEEEFKFRKDTFYWNRLTGSANIAQNVGSLASNLMQYGKGSLISGLQAINDSSTAFDKAVESGFSTLSNQGAFYGGLGSSASGLLNQRDAKQDAQALLSASTTRPLPMGASFSDIRFDVGAPYRAAGVEYTPASMSTVNQSGERTLVEPFRITTTIEEAP